MSIEEKAEKEYPYVNSIDYPETCSYNKTSRNGFIHGAGWMLEKAADWIGDNVVFDKFGRPTDIENFRKAMEE